MDKITEAQEDNLQDYLDGQLEGTALQQLKRDLAGSSGLQNRLEELRAVHTFLKGTSLQSPSASFVQRVMNNLHSGYSSTATSPRNGIILILGVLLATGMLVVMVSAGVFDQLTGLISLNESSSIKNYLHLSIPALPVNGKLLINMLIGLNLVLAFIVLDRTVLRPFFQRRAHTL